MDIAESVSYLSPDPKKKVGAILITKKKNGFIKIISVGYNRFVESENQYIKKLNWDDREYTKLHIIHAEVDCLSYINKNDELIGERYMLCTLSPCIECFKYIIEYNINTVFFKEKKDKTFFIIEKLAIEYNISLIQI